MNNKIEVFPAIDIRNGHCVRLTEGRFDQETVYGDNPVEMALRWYREGGRYLHVVDLDGALAGQPVGHRSQQVPIVVHQKQGSARLSHTVI